MYVSLIKVTYLHYLNLGGQNFYKITLHYLAQSSTAFISIQGPYFKMLSFVWTGSTVILQDLPFKYLLWDIASLCINLSLKTVQFSPPIIGKFCETNILFFSPRYLELAVLTKYFVKKNYLCPEKGLHFCYFTLTLGHFYTFNTWNSQKKAFPQSCRYGKYLSFAPFHLHPYNCFGGWTICISLQRFFFAEL